MPHDPRATAAACLAAAYDGSMQFPAIVGALMAAGFEGYDVDYRLGTATYHRPGGDGVRLPLPAGHAPTPVAAAFSADGVERAVREAQSGAPGYTYAGFCERVKAAGCAGYMVSFTGRRVLYFGRTAEVHVEPFP
jgi:uncharacterized protein YbcV (DUF1398 family)